MTENGAPPVAGDQGTGARSPAALAREWASAIGTTAYVPMSLADIRHYVHDLTERLVAALSDPALDTRAASEVGARLVAGDFTGPHSLSRSVEVLARALPATVEGGATGPPGHRVIELLGALVAGYTQALRNRIFDQQEEVKRALLRARQDIERDLQASESRFREVFNSSAVGIAISYPGGRIMRTNPALDDILGYSEGELPGRELSELFSPDDLATIQESYQRLLDGKDSRFRVQFRLRRKDGETAWVYLAVSVLVDNRHAPQYLATMVEDFTDQHLLTERLNHQALHDLQTGLPNRQYFVSHLEKVLGLEPSAMVTLLHLDLDGFSVINDGLGHHFGDRLLDVVARRLESVVADERAMVARLSGDEFAILIQHGLLPPGYPVPDVGPLAEAINTELAEPLYLDEIGVAATASIGVVQRQAGGTKPAELLRAAGATLRRSRGTGKRQWAAFDAAIDAADRAELRLAAATPGALETGELRVEYQPMVTLEGGRLVGIEAVLRWQHPQLGALSHERCMQVAEQTGAVYAAGQWLLRTAADQARSWRRRTGDDAPPLVVNLTPSQAQDPDLVARARAVIEETGLRPEELELWMPVAAIRTVSGMPVGEAGGTAEDNLGVLAELGVRSGLHDFGGGIGGLRCLAELPVRAVRVAEPVARQVADDPSRILSQAVHALVHIVRAEGINVVAFPVDSEEQAGCWRWVGANWAVGALFGRPGPPQHIEQLLDAQADR
ncbi:MAG: putative bifunctional diguanylate cyclase/phosphodiesterase [Pseudonocardiaceae bacterium]